MAHTTSTANLTSSVPHDPLTGEVIESTPTPGKPKASRRPRWRPLDEEQEAERARVAAERAARRDAEVDVLRSLLPIEHAEPGEGEPPVNVGRLRRFVSFGAELVAEVPRPTPGSALVILDREVAVLGCPSQRALHLVTVFRGGGAHQRRTAGVTLQTAAEVRAVRDACSEILASMPESSLEDADDAGPDG